MIYNLEQMARQKTEELRPVLRDIAVRFPVWEFSEANLPMWRALGARSVEVVKIGWAPVLERIVPAEPQDIEVLMYGAPSGERCTTPLANPLRWRRARAASRPARAAASARGSRCRWHAVRPSSG